MVFREFKTSAGERAWALAPSLTENGVAYIRQDGEDTYHVFTVANISGAVDIKGFLAAQAKALELLGVKI